MLDGDDEKLEETYGKLFSLTQFLSEDNFKSYDELKEKFNRVVTGTGISGTVEKFTAKPAPVTEPATTGESDNDETLSYFAKVADED